MKTLVNMVLVAIVAFSLSACAALKGGPTDVRCPKCGHEFTWSEEG